MTMALVHLYDMLFLNMIFTFNITVYDYPTNIKIIDLFYTCGAICLWTGVVSVFEAFSKACI